ncbi:MAG: membrane protein insertase YidC [Bacteroidota bacterium]|nr:membrane protein insertase YidC [Bacteroidota bacterium]
MDRNVVIAIILITGILVIWMYMMPPPPQPVVEEVLPDTDLMEQEASEAPRQQTPGTGLETRQDMRHETRIIEVVTDLYTARLSDLGGTLVGFALNEYLQFDQVSQVQLVDTTLQGALGIEFQSPDGRNIDSRDLVFTTARTFDRIEATSAPEELVFETQLGTGTLALTYTFMPGSYEIGLRVDHRNASVFQSADGYEIVWNGAIPFSEDIENRQEEISKVGAYARSGDDVDGINLNRNTDAGTTLRGNVSWMGVKSKYFGAVVLTSRLAEEAELWGERIGDADEPSVAVSFRTSLFMGQTQAESDQFALYIGPMDYRQIRQYDGVYQMVDYGWDAFEWMTRPLATIVFIPAFNLLSSFISNYGLVIIVLCLGIKVLLFPLTRSSYKSMARMRELQPKMQEIREKFKDDPQKQQQATIKMYRETGVNPLGSCLPMLLQYPIIIALWQFLQQSIEIRQQGFLWAADLSAPDAILELPFTLPFYGDFVAGFALLMGASMVLQMRLQATPAAGMQGKIFMYVMPVVLLVVFNRLPSGLSLYYLCYNIFSVVQQKLMSTGVKEDIKEKKTSPRGHKPPRKAVKSRPRSRKRR